jgi:hypothetical protein
MKGRWYAVILQQKDDAGFLFLSGSKIKILNINIKNHSLM